MTDFGVRGLALIEANGSPEYDTSRKTSIDDAMISGIATSSRLIEYASIDHLLFRDGPLALRALRRVCAQTRRSVSTDGWDQILPGRSPWLLRATPPGGGVPEDALLGRVVADAGEGLPEGQEVVLLEQRHGDHVVGQQRVDLVVERLLLGLVGLLHDLREEVVDLLVAELAVVGRAAALVDRRVAGQERPADPGEVGDVEVAARQPLAEVVGGQRVVDPDGDADLLHLGLEQLALALAQRVAPRGGEPEGELLATLGVDAVGALGVPGALQELLGPGHVTLAVLGGEVVLVEVRLGRQVDPVAQRLGVGVELALAPGHHLRQVEAGGDGLADL